MRLKKILVLVLALALIVSAFAGCSSNSSTGSTSTGGSTSSGSESSTADNSADSSQAEPAETGTTGGTLNYRIGMEATSLNTMKATYSDEFQILSNVYEPLTRMNVDTGNYEGAAAETIDVSDDGLVYTFHLRDNVWTNGDPVTANDFAFAWQEALNPEVAAEYASFLYFISGAQDYYDGKITWDEVGVKVIDDKTLEVTLHTPVPYAMELFAFGTLYPVNQKFYEEVGADNYNTEAEYFCSNGPFKVTEWNHNQNVLVEKFDDFREADLISLDAIDFKIITETSAALNAFLAGDIDFSGDLTTAEDIAMVEASGFEVQNFTGRTIYYINVNTGNEYLSNVNLRKALALAINKQEFIDATRGDASVPMSYFAANTDIDGHSFGDAALAANGGEPYYPAEGDPDAAKEYLQQALDELGITVSDLDGLRLDVNDSSLHANYAAYLQEAWRNTLGFTVEVRSTTTKQLAQQRDDHEYDLSFGGWGPDYNDPISDLDLWSSDNGNNDTLWANDEYDGYINIARTSVDPDEREAAFIECERMISENYPILPIFNSSISYALSDRIESGFVYNVQQRNFRYVKLAE